MAVCLTKEQHGSGEAGIRADLRALLNDLGGKYEPSGTAPLGKIIESSKISIDNIEYLPVECKELAKTKLASQIKQKNLNPKQPGRTLESPLPSGKAVTVLQRGYY